MIDVVEIAKERRVRLAAELAKMDDFIRMAEALVKYCQRLDRGPVMDAHGAAPRVRLADRGHDADIIREDVKARDRGSVESIEATIPAEGGVPNVFSQSDHARNKALTQAIDESRADSDHFEFDDKASENEDELVLIDTLSNDATPVGAHVGQRMRQRRWMMGITQQLGDLVGVKFEQLQK